MDEKGKESTSERVSTNKEREFEEDCYIHIVLFTAGIALLMACFKRVLMVFLLEEWRAWVFLFLNLVLLAILFTSTLSTPKESNNVEEVLKSVERRDEKIKRQSSKCSTDSEPIVVVQSGDKYEDNCHNNKKIICKRLSPTKNQVSCREDDKVEAPRLSKEELNERAEAFIVMFRQHLVLDARKSGKH